MHTFKPAASVCFMDQNSEYQNDTLWTATYAVLKHKQPRPLTCLVTDNPCKDFPTSGIQSLERLEVQSLKLFMVLTDLWDSPVNQYINDDTYTNSQSNGEAATMSILYVRHDQKYKDSFYPRPRLVHNPLSLTHALGHNDDNASFKQYKDIDPKQIRGIQVNMLYDVAYHVPKTSTQ